MEDFIYIDVGMFSDVFYNCLVEFIREYRMMFIFINMRSGVERVVFNFKKCFFEFEGLIEVYYFFLLREVCLDVEEKLKRGELKVVVCVFGDLKILIGKGFVEIGCLNLNMIVGIWRF